MIEPLIQIVWISEATSKLSDDQLIRLLEKSRANNVRHGVTGLLLHDRMSFMQFMEGEKSVVENIFEHRIQPSKTHKNVTLLSNREIEERNFKNWNMGFIAKNHKSLQSMPGYREFSQTKVSFLDLEGDPNMVDKIISGFHGGRWHLGQPVDQPNPLKVIR